jgi:glycosyltransferase involved in cell wall biosynthesis
MKSAAKTHTRNLERKRLNIIFANHVYLEEELSSSTQLSIINSLNKRGNKASLVVPCVNSSASTQNIKRLKTYTKSSFVSTPFYNLKLFFYLPYILKQEHANYVILDYCSFLGAMPLMLLSKCRLLRTKFIFDVRSPPVESCGLTGFMRLRLYDAGIIVSKYLAQGITFLTPMMKEEESRKYHIRGHTGVWTCGVDEKKFLRHTHEAAAKRLRAKLHFEGKFVIMYHGVFTPTRGLQNAIRAMSILKRRIPEAVLFLLGAGPAKKELQSVIRHERLERTVIIHEPVSHREVPKYIAMADIGILPFPKHKFWNAQNPIKLSEYLAMEVPVVLTDISAHSQVIGRSKAGKLFQNNSPEEISRAIINMYREKKYLPTYGSEGRNIILAAYTYDAIAKNLEDFLKTWN